MVYVLFENPSGLLHQLRRGPYDSVQVLDGELFVLENRGGQRQRSCLAYEDAGSWHVHAGAEGAGSVWESVRFDPAGESDAADGELPESPEEV